MGVRQIFQPKDSIAYLVKEVSSNQVILWMLVMFVLHNHHILEGDATVIKRVDGACQFSVIYVKVQLNEVR